MSELFRAGVIIVISSFTCLLLFGCGQPGGQVMRVGRAIGIDKKNIEEYKRLHADTWEGVLKMINKANIRNYSIYLGEVEKDKYYLFSYFDYIGDNYEEDMKKVAADEETQKWLKLTDPLQKPLPTRGEGEWWAQWEEVFHFEGSPSDNKPKRYSSIIGLSNRKEDIIAYKQFHAAVWPGVLATIEKANIRNYSIYLGELEKGAYLMFSYFEYVGDDFEADMAAIGRDEVTKIWWSYMEPLQIPLPTRKDGEWWASMEEVFHTD